MSILTFASVYISCGAIYTATLLCLTKEAGRSIFEVSFQAFIEKLKKLHPTAGFSENDISVYWWFCVFQDVMLWPIFLLALAMEWIKRR